MSNFFALPLFKMGNASEYTGVREINANVGDKIEVGTPLLLIDNFGTFLSPINGIIRKILISKPDGYWVTDYAFIIETDDLDLVTNNLSDSSYHKENIDKITRAELAEEIKNI